MPHLALYRKYRSEDFAQLAGQKAIVDSLEKAVATGRISHAYLFSGPRGVGKTSAARILARRINKLSLKQADNHLDIIEIDAASNRRIDEIRDLREKVHVAPTSAPYKVYIIDEVHMLTTEAFNALLKTLEEPPEHVVFVLATTEIYKLPETIISRTQHFRFQPISSEAASDHLAQVAKKEKISIEPEALALIARAGGGSLRDCLSILDQLSHSKSKITAKAVRELLGWSDEAALTQLATDIALSQPKAVLKRLDNLLASGVSAAELQQQLLDTYLQTIRAQLGIEQADQSKAELSNVDSQRLQLVISKLSQLNPNSSYFAASFEAKLLEISLQGAKPAAMVEPKPNKPVPAEPRESPTKQLKPQKKTSKQPDTIVKDVADGWIKVLMAVKEQNNSLYALLRSAEADISDQSITVTFRFKFHQRRLEESANRQILAKAIQKVFGQDLELVIATSKEAANSSSGEDDKEAINSVLQILGGEVVNG